MRNQKTDPKMEPTRVFNTFQIHRYRQIRKHSPTNFLIFVQITDERAEETDFLFLFYKERTEQQQNVQFYHRRIGEVSIMPMAPICSEYSETKKKISQGPNRSWN